MRSIALLVSAVLVISSAGLRASESTEASDWQTLDTVLVTGEQPGPGLWRVSRDGHHMWVLGTVTPLPRRMQWISDEVEARIAESTVVLMTPSVTLSTGMGRFRSALLLPSLLKARRNPDGKRLQAVLPPELHERWTQLKNIYLPGNRAVERWRPLFAAEHLHDRAIRKMGMRQQGVVHPVVERTAKQHEVEVVQPRVEVVIDEPRQMLREFSGSALDDLECFRLTLTHLETDLSSLARRANAWAEGDIDELRETPLVDRVPTCIETVLRASVLSERGLDELPTQVREKWLSEAERILSEHAVSFAVLPMRLVLDDDGLLAVLAARGYEVLAPDQIDVETDENTILEQDSSSGETFRPLHPPE